MTATKPKYSLEEFAQKGQILLEKTVLPLLAENSRGKIVAIDIESGQFALGESTLAAAQELRMRMPDAQIWCARVGFPAVHRIG